MLDPHTAGDSPRKPQWDWRNWSKPRLTKAGVPVLRGSSCQSARQPGPDRSAARTVPRPDRSSRSISRSRCTVARGAWSRTLLASTYLHTLHSLRNANGALCSFKSSTFFIEHPLEIPSSAECRRATLDGMRVSGSRACGHWARHTHSENLDGDHAPLHAPLTNVHFLTGDMVTIITRRTHVHVACTHVTGSTARRHPSPREQLEHVQELCMPPPTQTPIASALRAGHQRVRPAAYSWHA